VTRQNRRRISIALFTAAAAVLVAALASFVVTVEYNTPHQWWTLENGRVRIGWVATVRRLAPGWYASRNISPSPEWSMQVPRARFSMTPFAFINVPLWIPALALALSGLTLHPRRPLPGRCVRCGYDLRATPSTEGAVVCPECGGRAAPARQ
jgi:hypothetical protein